MALSGSRDFIHTRDTIIQAAFRKIGIGNQTDSTLISQAAEALNTLVAAWQERGVFLWTVEQASATLVDGTAYYDADAEALAVLPESLYWRDANGADQQIVNILSRAEYDALLDKDSSGAPTSAYIESRPISANASVQRIYLWPVPSSNEDGQTLYYRVVKRLQDFDASGDNPDFPVSASRALIYGLAYELAPEYGIPIAERDRLRVEADREFLLLRDSSTESTGRIQIGIDRS